MQRCKMITNTVATALLRSNTSEIKTIIRTLPPLIRTAPGGEWRKASTMTETYVLIRTEPRLRSVSDSCKSLIEAYADAYIGTPEVCRFERGSRVFADGYVMRFNVMTPLPELCAELSAPLRTAIQWLIYRPGEDFMEFPVAGPMGDGAWLLKG